MTTAVSESDILSALRQVIDPDLHRDIVTLGFVQNLTIEPTAVRFTLELTTPACPVREQFVTQCRAAIQQKFPQITTVDVTLSSRVRKDPGMVREQYLVDVANVILVGAGKGGVGKSTVALNLALALAHEGARVGLLDADVYGPSVPTMMGLPDAHIEARPDGRMIPLQKYGLTMISVGFMSSPGQALPLRGPMLDGIMKTFLGKVEWGALDYLIVDLPPGTGDVQLTLLQTIKATGAVVVTTPQDVALADVARAINMFKVKQLAIPVLGVVENMSVFCCPNCGHETRIFLSGGGKKISEQFGIPLLGSIPLDVQIPESGDIGMPVMVRDPESPTSRTFIEIARSLVRRLHHVEPAADAVGTSR